MVADATKSFSEGRYQWCIGVLLALLFFLLGVFVENERFLAQVAVNTNRIDTLENNYGTLNTKVDAVLHSQTEILVYLKREGD